MRTRTTCVALALLLCSGWAMGQREWRPKVDTTEIFSAGGLQGMNPYIDMSYTGGDYETPYPVHIRGDAKKVNFTEASKLCGFIKPSAGAGWRLPTRAELDAFVAANALPQYKFPRNQHFPFTGGLLWTSDQGAYRLKWSFDTNRWEFAQFSKSVAGSDEFHVICVRGKYGGPAAKLEAAAPVKEETQPIRLTKMPDRKDEDAAADARNRAAAAAHAATEAKRVAAENARQQLVAFEHEIRRKQECAKPINRTQCGCRKYNDPQGTWKTCSK